MKKHIETAYRTNEQGVNIWQGDGKQAREILSGVTHFGEASARAIVAEVVEKLNQFDALKKVAESLQVNQGDRMTNLSPEARSLLSDLLTLASFKPDYMESQGVFNMRRCAWKDITEAPECAMIELEQLAKPANTNKISVNKN